MNNRSFSEEEMRQREKEERSRLRKQEQAYREAQRGVYSRIYQEQDAMPEDYRAAFWEAILYKFIYPVYLKSIYTYGLIPL